MNGANENNRVKRNIGPVGYTVADVIDLATPGTTVVTLSCPDASNVDFSSLTFAAAVPVTVVY